MYFLVEHRFLIYYDEEYWKTNLPDKNPVNYLNSDLYNLNKRGSHYLHNRNGPAIIDLNSGQELFFIEGKRVEGKDLHNMTFKNSFESMINNTEETEKEIEVATYDSYNGKSKWKMTLKRKDFLK